MIKYITYTSLSTHGKKIKSISNVIFTINAKRDGKYIEMLFVLRSNR